MTSTMKKIIAIGMIAAMGATAIIGGTLAYFTDEKEKENVFTFGDIEINLVENNGLDETNNDYAEDDTKDDSTDYTDWLEDQFLFPNQPVEKDVFLRNDGTNEAYVRVKVDVPTHLVPIWDDSVGSDWVIVSTEKDTDSTMYTLNYTKILAVDATTPDCLSAITLDKYFDDRTLQGTEAIVMVYGEAIQTVGFANADEAFAALDEQLLING